MPTNPFEPPKEVGTAPRKKRRWDWPTVALAGMAIWFGFGLFAIATMWVLYTVFGRIGD